MRIGKTKGFYVNVYSRNSGVTGSGYLHSVHWPDGRNVRFLIDAGAAQGRDNDGAYNYFFPYNAEKIDFIILTHGHHDHQGLLPVVVRQGFKGRIYTHYATSMLMKIGLFDNCNIPDLYSGEPLYSRKEVETTLDKVIGCAYKKILKPSKNIRVVFYTNGHLVGAVLTLIVISCPGEDDITLIHTGDYKNSNIFFDVESLPKQTREMKISAVFCESTYGDVDSTDSKFKKCLKENTVQALDEGKTIIYPVFSQGRCQEILYHIKMWKEKGIIPENIPIYLDGKTAQQYTTNYMYADLGIKNSMKNFTPKGLHFVPRTKAKLAYRKETMDNDLPKMIVASGGTVTNGAVTDYIKNYVERTDALIHIVGYCGPESEGHKLINVTREEKIQYKGKEYIMRCSVKKTSEISSHAPRNILLNLIKEFPDTKSVVVGHGETEVRCKFREYLLEHLQLPEEMIAISGPEIAVRIESDGIVDQFKPNLEELF